MTSRPSVEVWPEVYALILELWRHRDRAARAALEASGVPWVLFDWKELGLEFISAAEYARRDPYAQIERVLEECARLEAAGWLERLGVARWRVSAVARAGVEAGIRAGDASLGRLEAGPADELTWLAATLEAIDEANLAASEPPAKWATWRRFRVPLDGSRPLGRVREAAMNVFAYRDDAHYAAWQQVLPAGGAVWNACTFLWRGEAGTPGEIATRAAFRGHDASAYQTALVTLEGARWAERTGERWALTAEGRARRDEVERLTDGWFYASWAALAPGEVGRLRDSVIALRRQLAGLETRAAS